MKFKRIAEAAYDADRRVLLIRGRDTIGRTSTVELPVNSPGDFLTSMMMAFQAEVETMDADIVPMGMKYEMPALPGGGTTLRLTFNVGGAALNFSLPLVAMDIGKINALRDHLEAVFRLLPNDPKYWPQDEPS